MQDLIRHSRRDMGTPAGARTLQEQALAVGRSVRGEAHPNTLTMAKGLLRTLRELGEKEQAAELMEEIMQHWEPSNSRMQE